MSVRRHIGNPEYLTKRIPQNPRYQHVKSRLDTGNSMTKYTEKLEEIKKNYRYKKDELFKRLKVTTFAQLTMTLQLQTLMVKSLTGPTGKGAPLSSHPALSNSSTAREQGIPVAPLSRVSSAVLGNWI
uniref:Centrosomal protein of 41 kDa n=1 Tax=Castor canadensis TaxID=51338 RepID=A0A8C0ZTW5_CASCN